jgi:hypothetical protein
VTQDVFVTKRPGGEQWNGQAAQEQIDLANLAVADAVHVLEPLTALEEDEGDHAARWRRLRLVVELHPGPLFGLARVLSL